MRAYRDGSRLIVEPLRWLRAFLAVLLRPWLWWVALRQVARMSRPHWWRHAPFLPVPPTAYLRFRLETAYGVVAAPAPADLVAYLEWCGSARPVAPAGSPIREPAIREPAIREPAHSRTGLRTRR